MKDKPRNYWTASNLEQIAASFDERWYVAMYWRDLRDLKQPGEQPLDFYLRIGGRLGHDPHRKFSELFFRTFNPDVYAHLSFFPKDFGYLLFVGEPRDKFPTRMVPTSLQCEHWRTLLVAVDRQFVAARYSIDEKTYISALDYYVRRSRHNPISPSRFFSEAYYRSTYPDVNAAILQGSLISGYHHFRIHGIKEGRQVLFVEDFEPIGLSALSRPLSALKYFFVRHRSRFLLAI